MTHSADYIAGFEDAKKIAAEIARDLACRWKSSADQHRADHTYETPILRRPYVPQRVESQAAIIDQAASGLFSVARVIESTKP